jgi:hypothetical protein
VDSVNDGLLMATGEIIVLSADDFYAPQNWDAQLSALVPDTSEKIALHCLTGSPRDNELFIPHCMTKTLWDAIGPYSPEYESMYADDESTLMQKRFGRVVETGLKFEHRHPIIFESAEMDEVYARQNSPEAYRIGRDVFERRRALGFPRVTLPNWPEPKQEGLGLVDGIKNRIGRFMNPPQPSLPRRNVAVCLPGETFNYEWLASVFNVNGALNELGINSQVFLGHCSGPHITRMMLTDAFLEKYSGDQSCPYVLWIDDDNLVPPDLIRRWISEFDANPKMDILAGWCWIQRFQRGVEWSSSLATFGADGLENKWLTLADIFNGGTGIREVKGLASGFPCVMMRREVLEVVGSAAFIPIANPKTKYGYVGEDFSFFWRAQAKGLRTFIDPLGKVGHLKFICQEPTLLLPDDASPEVKQWREKINGKPVVAPKEFSCVEA